jgi:hypothetical protein
MAITVAFRSTVCDVGQTSADGAVGTEPGVASAVRLLHRRHGWTRITITSFIGCALGEGATLNADSQGTPVPGWWVGITIALAALTAAGIIASVIVSAQLRRTPVQVLAAATPIAARHPHRPHAHHWPARHVVLWTVRWLGMLLILFMSVVIVSAPVDGVAYLAGAGKVVTFDPISHQTTCTLTSGTTFCDVSTNGLLETGINWVSATWPSAVPLNKPFPVHLPLWRWGIGGGSLINNDRIAVVAIIVGLLVDAFGVVILIFLVRLARDWRRSRQQRASLASAPAT